MAQEAKEKRLKKVNTANRIIDLSKKPGCELEQFIASAFDQTHNFDLVCFFSFSFSLTCVDFIISICIATGRRCEGVETRSIEQSNRPHRRFSSSKMHVHSSYLWEMRAIPQTISH
jgi:hypothetical protein